MHCPSAAPARTCRVTAPGRRGGCFGSGDGGCFTSAHARALLQAQHVLGMHGWAPGRQGGPATRGRASPRSSPATSSSGNAGGAGSHASAAARSSPSCRPCTLRRKHTCPSRPRSSPVSGLGWWHAPLKQLPAALSGRTLGTPARLRECMCVSGAQRRRRVSAARRARRARQHTLRYLRGRRRCCGLRCMHALIQKKTPSDACSGSAQQGGGRTADALTLGLHSRPSAGRRVKRTSALDSRGCRVYTSYPALCSRPRQHTRERRAACFQLAHAHEQPGTRWAAHGTKHRPCCYAGRWCPASRVLEEGGSRGCGTVTATLPSAFHAGSRPREK